MQNVCDDINDNNNGSHKKQNTKYSSRDTEEQSKEPDDKNQDDNSPQNGMKHDNYSFSNVSSEHMWWVLTRMNSGYSWESASWVYSRSQQ